MARVTLTPVTVVGPYPSLQPAADSLDFAFAAADATNKEQFACTGREIILAQNSGAGARTITVTSVANGQNRTGDITSYSIGAGQFAAFKVAIEGWRQSDGNVYIEAEHAEVKWVILRY